MTRHFIPVVLMGFASAGAAGAPSPTALVGHWQNPKHTTVVDVRVCGDGPGYCAVVVKASAKTQENARKGGTQHFIGTEILRVHQAGPDLFKGTAFDPESNRQVDATVRMVGPGVMEMKGCAMMGLICQEQEWTRAEPARSPSSTKAKRPHPRKAA